MFDRYQSIIGAIESNKVTNTIIDRYNSTKWVPTDFTCFTKWHFADEYNHYLYSRIIEFINKIPFEYIVDEKNTSKEIKTENIIDGLGFKGILKRLNLFYVKCIPQHFNKIVMISSYLDLVDLLKLQIVLKQMPYVISPSVTVPESNIDFDKRKLISISFANGEFEKLLSTLIKDHMPTVYIEGYGKMKDKTLDILPNNPKVIFTANAFESNEAFKIWAAEYSEKGAKMVGAQHGGHYGTGLWSSAENHELLINDKYFSWGWKSETFNNVIPIAAAKLNLVKKSIRSKPNGDILLVLMALPRYSYQLYSVPTSSTGMLDYFSDQYKFVNSLSLENQKNLCIRLFKEDYEWNQVDRWRAEFPNIRYYQGSKSIFKQLNNSRLFVGTYNSTTFLETFAANFPTIIFWDPKKFEINKSADIYFEKLRNAGILFYDPKMAAEKVNEIVNDPEKWWNQESVQQAKNEFCNKFANTTKNWLFEWKCELEKIANY